MNIEKAVFKYLDVSTGNLPKTEFDALEKVATKHEYGMWLYVPDVDSSEHLDPYPYVTNIVKAARVAGCRWINFDRDADCLEGFPSFNW